MTWSILDEEWGVLAGLLPANWRDLARETGAIRHEKGITDPAVLLRLLLLHVAGGLSLRSAVARAPEVGLERVSSVALFKRLRAAEGWLGAMAAGMYVASRHARRVDPELRGRRLRAVDATTVHEPGKTGSEWRVHFSVTLPQMACDFYELTDVHGGETYKRFPVKPGDVILGDRGYCHREGVAHVLRAGGDVLVRLNSTSFPLLDTAGQSFSLLTHLRQLNGRRCRAWAVRFDAGEDRFAARLCAVRKSQLAAERAKQKIRQEDLKKQRTSLPETFEFAEYVFVLTTLAKEKFPASLVLELYRARWQIELVFKRMKSLLRLGHLPKKSDASSRAWIQGKLLTVLLIERLLEQADFFPPGDTTSTRRSRWREFIEGRDSVLGVLVPAIPPSRLLRAARRLGPRLAAPPARRPIWTVPRALAPADG